MKSFFELRESVKSADKKPETYTGPDGKTQTRMVAVDKQVVKEKTLTPAEKKKREEIARAMERENPGMDMSKKMAIATAQAKKVAEATLRLDVNKASDDELKHYVKKTTTTIARSSSVHPDVLHTHNAAQKELKKRQNMREAAFDDESKAHDRHYEKQTPRVQSALDSYVRKGMSYKQAHAKISGPGHVLRKEITPLHEELELDEAADQDLMRFKQLARLGLVDKSEAEKLVQAFKRMKEDKPLSMQQRTMLLGIVGDLISIVVGDQTTFMKAKKAVAEDVEQIDELSARKLGQYSIKAAQQGGDKRISGQWMADQKVRKKEGKSSTAKVPAK